MTSETPKNFVNHLLSSALSQLKWTSLLDVLEISPPSNPDFGDYSSNAALVLGKKLKRNPKEIAAEIVSQIQQINLEGKLESVEEKGGFVNFKLSKKFLLDNLDKIIEQRDLFGCSLSGEGKTI